MPARRQGEVEKATRALVKEMGAVSARQKLTAAKAYALARLIDEEADGSKAAALSRELRQLVAALTPAAAPMPVRGKDEKAAGADQVTNIQDALAAKQRRRGQA